MDNRLENTNETNQNEPAKSEPVDTKALEARIKALETENGKLRQSVTNASADASQWKKKYQDTLPEIDKAKAAQDEQTAAMQKELEQLRNERNIAKYTGALVANDIGMDAETAKSVAEALNAGETDKVFDGIRKFVITHDKASREAAIRGNQTLPGGKPEETVTKAQFDAMGYREMVEFKQSNPELYEKYMNR